MPNPVQVILSMTLCATLLLGIMPVSAAETGMMTNRSETKALVEAARQLPAQDLEKEHLYRAALKLSPSDPKILFNLALLLQHKGNYTEAIQRYQGVLKQNPADAIAHYNLANVLLALDDADTWQSSAWHFRQFMFYANSGERKDKARNALNRLESNLAALYSPYRDNSYSREQLINRLSRVEPADTVRGNSKYDGPRIPLMLNFAVQSAELTPAAKQKLDDIAAVLKVSTLHNDRIQIEGYTDSHEHPEFEQRMQYAQERAERVRQYLQQAHKLPSKRFTVKALADLEIISANNTSEGRAANRRVELYNLSTGRKITAPLHN